jgi:hypothetical protein
MSGDPENLYGNGGAGFDPDREQREQEAQQYALGYGERAGYVEMAYKSKPEEVRHDTRMFDGLNLTYWYEHRKPPNSYLINHSVIPALEARAAQMGTSLPLGLSRYTKFDKKNGLDKDRPDEDPGSARERRTKLAKEYKSSSREVRAVQELLEVEMEQEVFEVDIDQYMVNRFLRLGKAMYESGHDGTILNLSPSYENRELGVEFEPFGEKVEKAFNAWIEVAEGRAVVDVNVQQVDGSMKKEPRVLPNPFAMPRNRGYMDKVIQGYVAPKVGLTFQPKDEKDKPKQESEITDKEEAVLQLEKFDNESAAIMALVMFRHWNFDGYYGLGQEGYTRNVGVVGEITSQELQNLTMDITWGDITKAIMFEGRRQAEYRGGPGETEGRRPHPRSVGPPSTLGCYPMLTSHSLDLMTVQVDARNKINPNERQKIGVSVHDFVYGDGESVRERSEENEEKGHGKKDQLVRWEYEKAKRLGDPKIWDNTELRWGLEMVGLSSLEGMSPEEKKQKLEELEVKVLDIVMGTPTHADNVPVGLQQFYAGKWMYGQLTRTDYQQQYNEITGTDLLKKMNKGIDIGLGIMSTGQNIDKKTMKKLNEYMRITYLGGFVASIAGPVGHSSVPEGEEMENRSQVTPYRSKPKQDIGHVAMAAATSGFIEAKEQEGKLLDWKHESHENLYGRIVKNRQAPTPFELEGEFFTTQELVKIKRMYPFAKW